MYTHSSSLCKYSAAQSIPTSVLAAEVIQKKALSVAVCMWDREACVFALVVSIMNKKGREMVAVSL